MVNTNTRHIGINTKKDLAYLIDRVDNGPLFAESFKFRNSNLFKGFLKNLKIDYDEFKTKYFYYDQVRRLHISESEFRFIWISTYGLVAGDTKTNNKFLNACNNQFVVISLLFIKAYNLIESKDIYDVDSYSFAYLSEITPALFHNILFYIELFGKAYLSLSNYAVPHTHNLNKIYSSVTNAIYKKDHNDTVFQAEIIAEFLKVCEYVASIPGGFKEEYIKYDDNSEDHTVITFDSVFINHINNVIKSSYDFIYDYYHNQDKAIHLKSGLLQRLIDKAKNEKEKGEIIAVYGYMTKAKLSSNSEEINLTKS